jgi:hypothetical protein
MKWDKSFLIIVLKTRPSGCRVFKRDIRILLLILFNYTASIYKELKMQDNSTPMQPIEGFRLVPSASLSMPSSHPNMPANRKRGFMVDDLMNSSPPSSPSDPLSLSPINSSLIGEELKRQEGEMKKKNSHKRAPYFFKKKALINYINANEGQSLFYALQSAKVRTLNELDKRKLYKYLNGKGRRKLQRDVEQLLHTLHIPLDLPLYNVEKWVPKIVEHWHGLLGNEYRLKVFIFGTNGICKPLYTYGPEKFTHPICLIKEGNFKAVKTAASIFGKNNYCFTCEVPFGHPIDHRKSCKSLCINCGRHGYKYAIIEQRCPVDDGFEAYCEGCGKKFTNRGCHQHHIKKYTCFVRRFFELLSDVTNFNANQ